MTAQKSWRRRVTSVFATATAGLLAVSGAVLAPTAAYAAPATIDGGTLEWGFVGSWRNYVTGLIADGEFSAGAPATIAGEAPDQAVLYVDGAGSVDVEAGSGTLTYAGSMVSYGHHGGLDQYLSNPQIALTSTSSATLSFEVTQTHYTAFPERAGEREVIANLTFEAGDLADGTVTASAVMAAPGAVTYGNGAFAAFAEGAPLDPVTFSFEVAPATTTSTTLGTLPGSIIVGDTVDLGATVAPAEAAGTVTFKNNGTAIEGATDLPVVDGSADVEEIALPLGTNSIVAEFAPANAAEFAASASAVQTVQVNSVPAAMTVTSLTSVSPQTRALLGDDVTLTAEVAAADEEVEVTPTGSIEFFTVVDGTAERVSLGHEDTDESGTASLTTDALTAGGHSFIAVFTADDSTEFATSESGASSNYGIVETGAPTPYEPGADAQTSEGATGSWGWSGQAWAESQWSPAWDKFVSGDVTLDAENKLFNFSNGTVTADAGGAVISFEGSLRTAAYTWYGPAQPDGFWIELIDPALHLNADGSGVWVAGVNTGAVDYTANLDAERIVVGVVDGYTGGGIGEEGERVVTLGFLDATAPGTWSAGRTGAWPADFILKAPGLGSQSVAPYYYDTSAANTPTKVPAQLNVNFDWPAVTETKLIAAPVGPVQEGTEVTLTAEVGPAAAAGKVEFFATSAVTGTESKIGEADVVDGVAEISTTELVAGGHMFRAKFTSSNGYTGSETVTTENYGVVDTSTAPACVPAEGSAAFDGVSATWGWSAYAANWPKEVTSGNGTVEDGAFVLTDGIAIVGEDCTQISFDATLLADPYRNYPIPDTSKPLIELSYPVLTIDAEGNGVWSADVRSGIGGLEGEAVEQVIATITGADALDFTQDVISTDIEFDFVDTTAVGTWSEGKTDAWANGFIMSLPSSVRAFFYASGSGSDATKAPAAISVDWAWDPAEPSAFVNGQEAAEVEPGETVTFTAGPFLERGADVSVEVHSDPISLGNVTSDPLTGVAEITWTIPADFEIGSTHSVIFTQGDVSATATFTVVAAPSGGDGGSGGGSDAAGGAGTAGGSDSKGLASTGANGMEGMIALGALALLIGAASILVARRRAASQQ
ncbi:MAG: Ig-like domain repeat protein [Leucobacter sp.]